MLFLAAKQMDNYKKRAFRVFQAASVFIILIGLVMVLVGGQATGLAGGNKGTTKIAVSYSGWQVSALGILLLLVSSFEKNKRNGSV